MADMYFNTKDRDWGEFYNSLGRTDISPVAQPSGELTTRSVKTVAIDPFTGQPISAGGPNPETLAVLNANMVGRGQPARMSTASPEVAAARLQPGSEGLPINPGGQYNPGNPLVLSALRAQQGTNPAVAAATAVAQGGIKPSWANSPGFGPKFPVAATPEIRAAYNAMVAGEPGAMKTYAALLADAAPTMGQAPAPARAVAAAPVNQFQTPAYLKTPAYKDAYRGSSGNVQGVSQYGRFYDLDRNEWVDTTKKPTKQRGSGGQSRSLLYNAGLGDGEAA